MLKYPLDLDAWQAWQRRQKKLKWAKYKLKALLDSARSRTIAEEPVHYFCTLAVLSLRC